MNVFLYVYMYTLYMEYPRQPGEGVGSPRTVVTGSCEPFSVVAGIKVMHYHTWASF